MDEDRYRDCPLLVLCGYSTGTPYFLRNGLDPPAEQIHPDTDRGSWR